MRIIRSSNLPAVVLVKGRGISVVAIPEDLPSHEILELASLVLSPGEYEEFRHAVPPAMVDQPDLIAVIQVSTSETSLRRVRSLLAETNQAQGLRAMPP
jgi:hypothetical protein